LLNCQWPLSFGGLSAPRATPANDAARKNVAAKIVLFTAKPKILPMGCHPPASCGLYLSGSILRLGRWLYRRNYHWLC
jgi:hypothetical protein